MDETKQKEAGLSPHFKSIQYQWAIIIRGPWPLILYFHRSNAQKAANRAPMTGFELETYA